MFCGDDTDGGDHQMQLSSSKDYACEGKELFKIEKIHRNKNEYKIFNYKLKGPL